MPTVGVWHGAEFACGAGCVPSRSDCFESWLLQPCLCEPWEATGDGSSAWLPDTLRETRAEFLAFAPSILHAAGLWEMK